MQQDSTYIVNAVVENDTLIVDIPKNDLKAMYRSVFGEAIDRETARDHLKLALNYVPMITVTLVLILVVNIRWDRAYSRLEKIKDKVSNAERLRIEKLSFDKYNIWDRFVFYLVIWTLSVMVDNQMIRADIFQWTWFGVATLMYIAKNILKRLNQGSTLRGKSDEEIISNIDGILDSMIIEPLTKGFVKMVTNFFKKFEKET